MPRCDSVRIDKNRVFPFLLIEPSGGIFDIILKSSDQFETFLNRNKPFEIKLIEFPHNRKTNGVIRASKNTDGEFCFNDTKSEEYIWISELRWAHAQRLAQKFANNLSRVGLDESEWLRRHSPK